MPGPFQTVYAVGKFRLQRNTRLMNKKYYTVDKETIYWWWRNTILINKKYYTDDKEILYWLMINTILMMKKYYTDE